MSNEIMCQKKSCVKRSQNYEKNQYRKFNLNVISFVHDVIFIKSKLKNNIQKYGIRFMYTHKNIYAYIYIYIYILEIQCRGSH